MNKLKSIEQIIAPPTPHWVGVGFRVHNFFPGNGALDIKRMSPFFLMDYGSKVELLPSEKLRGVRVHPYRGFETVTIAYHGRIAHHDSVGNSGIIGEGDVQWMTAGSGILHKEYHEAGWSKQGGEFQMVQLWVNLPAKHKMSNPNYQPIMRNKMANYILPDNKGGVEVIAGNFRGYQGPAYTFTPIEMYNVRLKNDADILISLPQNYNTGFLIIEGSVIINGENATTDHFILFANDGTEVHMATSESVIMLILSGEPINEPIFPYGPFLMNTKQEIMQAYEDLNSGKFGYLGD